MSKKLTTAEYIARIVEKYGDKFDLSKVDYINNSTNVTIICRIHGEFYPKPSNFPRKSECPKCKLQKFTTKEIIARFLSTHGTRYTYDKFVFSGKVMDKGIITCPMHGDFTQRIRDHLAGSNCPECAKLLTGWSRSAYKNRKTILYYIKVGDYYKIGITRNSVKQRFLREQDKKLISVIKEWVFTDGSRAYDLEHKLLAATKEYTYKGPPILTGGNQEIRIKDVSSTIIELIEKERKQNGKRTYRKNK